MKYYIGIDGGGSKTKINCFDKQGRFVSEIITGSTDYHQNGVDGVIQTLSDALAKLNIDPEHCLIGFGMPTFGENKEDDAKAVFEIKKALSPARLFFENDVVCAWAGAMALAPGVTVVCGTGCMSVGRDYTGKMARCGGWCEFFSDEGSGYWLGKKTLELFSKQSDFRMPKGALYEIVRDHFHLKDDLEIIHIIESDYAHSRDKIASLQMLLLKAHQKGDETATEAYQKAVSEAVLTTAGSIYQLDFEGKVIDVSYVGGLFNEKELMLDAFTREIKKQFQVNVQTPKLSPCHGALLLALETFEKEKLKEIKEAFEAYVAAK